MNLLTGRIAEIFIEGGITKAKVSVGGAHFKVAMMLLMDAKVGDKVMVESGVAISKLNSPEERETADVSRDPR
jgi:hydrogenase maturation factor